MVTADVVGTCGLRFLVLCQQTATHRRSISVLRHEYTLDWIAVIRSWPDTGRTAT